MLRRTGSLTAITILLLTGSMGFAWSEPVKGDLPQALQVGGTPIYFQDDTGYEKSRWRYHGPEAEGCARLKCVRRGFCVRKGTVKEWVVPGSLALELFLEYGYGCAEIRCVGRKVTLPR